MTEADIKAQVLSHLGAPVLKVELDPCVWDTIFADAKRWFRAKKGIVDCATFTIVQGKKDYDLPTNALAVLDVILPTRNDLQALVTLGFFDIVSMNQLRMGNSQSSFYSYSGYVQVLQALETRRKVFNSDPDWYEACGKIFITAGVCTGTGLSSNELGGTALVFFTKKDFGLDELKGRDEDIIFRYCLMKAKNILGRVRSKYGSYPAAGGTIDTDGKDLLEEARLELEILEEEISESQYPISFVVG